MSGRVASDDWRLQGQDWLRAEVLRFAAYRPARQGVEHDHCEFCFVRFRTAPQAAAAHEGFVTSDRRWICEACYEDFKLMFDWVIET